MKIHLKILGSFLLAILWIGQTVTPTFAAEENYSITVVKVQMTKDVLESNPFPLDGTKIDVVKDHEGNELKALPRVTYVIERVTPSNGADGFEVIEGADALKQELVTDEDGVAHFIELPQGMYRVTEKENEQIQTVMKPVILELPLPQTNGDSLKDVYLYPKSSIVPGEIPKKDGEENDSSHIQPGKKPIKIPQTSGNIGKFYPIAWSLAFVFFMGSLGMYVIFRKNTEA
ncbi:pilin N-terminal domain-containing protein [Enterococcus sp. LJL98]